MLILIDNYDSFTYNLVHYLGELGAACEVIRNDKISAADVLKKKPKAIVLSPGPCTPRRARPDSGRDQLRSLQSENGIQLNSAHRRSITAKSGYQSGYLKVLSHA